MKKILLITHNQFGYQTDFYKYAQHLKKDFDVTYFCFDYGKEKVAENNIRVIYSNRQGSRIKRIFDFLLALRKNLKDNSYHLIILKHFPFSGFINFFTKDRILLAIQTGGVTSNHLFNSIFNFVLRMDAKLFKKLIILSDDLRKHLKLDKNKSEIVPLGSDILSKKSYNYDELNLIYIGSLDNRNIDKTIIGVKEFLENNDTSLSYTLIGKGKDKEENKIRSLIEKYKLDRVVNFIGFVQYEELPRYIENCNVGVSFIPITSYFNEQPPTKTVEYLLSGLPTIATATKGNSKLINGENGVLIEDTSNGFSRGLEKISNRKFDNSKIRQEMENYKWENVVDLKLKPLINNLLKA